MKSLSGSAKSLAKGLTAILGTRAMIGAINGAIEYGSALTDAALATNTNIEALQVFRAAARNAGADANVMEKSLVRIQKAGIDARNGLSTMVRAFAALNVDVEKFNKMPTEQKFEEIARGMAEADDQQAAYAAALDIMGTKNAPRLMEVLRKIGKDGYGALAEEIKKTNNIMTETDAQELDAAADSIAKMQENLTKFTGNKVAFWLQFFDAVKNGSGSVENLRSDVALFVIELEKVVAVYNKIENAVDTVAGLVNPFHKIFSEMRESWSHPEMSMGGAYDTAFPVHSQNDRAAEPPPPVAPPPPAYDSFAESGDEAYGLKAGEWVKISADQLAELQKARELQAQTLALMKETNEEVEKAQDQAANNRS